MTRVAHLWDPLAGQAGSRVAYNPRAVINFVWVNYFRRADHPNASLVSVTPQLTNCLPCFRCTAIGSSLQMEEVVLQMNLCWCI